MADDDGDSDLDERFGHLGVRYFQDKLLINLIEYDEPSLVSPKHLFSNM